MDTLDENQEQQISEIVEDQTEQAAAYEEAHAENGSAVVKDDFYQDNEASPDTEFESTIENLEEDMNPSFEENAMNRNINRNKNTQSSIFHAMMESPQEAPRKRAPERPTTLPADTVDAASSKPVQNGDINKSTQSPKKSDGNPITGEGYGPRDGHGIGAYHQHSNVPPGGFTSDFWKSL